MNRVRRKSIREAIDLMEQAWSILEDVMGDEQDAFDNLPESLQESSRGEAMESAIETLESCLDSLEEAEHELSSLLPEY